MLLPLVSLYIYSNAHMHGLIKLVNGNFLLISCKGKFILDPAFNKINELSTNDALGSSYKYETLISFQEEDGGYIIFIASGNQYILSPNGNLINSDSIYQTQDKLYYLYSIVPFKFSKDDELQYLYIYFESTNSIKFDKYSYNITSKQFKKQNRIYSSQNIFNNINNGLITCQLMKYSHKNVIACFFVVNDINNSNNQFINCTVFDPDNFLIINSTKSKTKGITNFYDIKSQIMTLEERTKALICSTVSTGNIDLYCAGYDIKTNTLTDEIIENQLINCNIITGFIGVSYFRETEEFIVSLINECDAIYIYTIYSFDNNFHYSFFGAVRDFSPGDMCCSCQKFKYFNYNDFYYHYIFFNSLAQRYCLIASVNGDGNIFALLIINKEVNVVNPRELKPLFNPLQNYTCENYSKKVNCSDYITYQNYLKNSSLNYLEKCSKEYNLIASSCTCGNLKNTSFDFSFKCSEKFPYEIIESKKCVGYCNSLTLNNVSCIINQGSMEQILDTILNNPNNANAIEDIRELFSSSNSDQLDKILEGDEAITVNSSNGNSTTILQITTTANQKNNSNPNISTINLGQCETTLKIHYNISLNKSLLMLKTDSYIEGSNIPIIQYELYHPDTKTKLELTYCNESNIEINIPVKIEESSLYKYEPDSDYYNDRCFIASEEGLDMPLKARRKIFLEKNMSLCEAECDYIGYDFKTKNSKCKCGIKNEINLFNIKINTDILKERFSSISDLNLETLKCYYLLFNKKYLTYNIGNYVILFIIIIHIIGLIVFIFKGYYLLNQKINYVIQISKQNLFNEKKKNNNLPTGTFISKKLYKNRRNKRKNKIKKKKNSNPLKKKLRKSAKVLRNIKLEKSDDNFGSTQNINLKNNNNELIGKLIQNQKIKKKKKYKKRKNNKQINKDKLKFNIFGKNGKFILNDYELNTLVYKEALLIDKRTYMEYYWSLLKKGDIFLFSFIPNNDYNSMVLKICLFFFSFGCYYTVNALFFTDSIMNKIFEELGEYDFIYQIPFILYSNLICTVINLIVKTLSLSERDILKIKLYKDKASYNRRVFEIRKCLLYKFIFFYLVSFSFLIIFWFYVGTFCAVYKNTQIYLIKDTVISFSLSILYPVGYYLIPGIFRIPSLRNKQNNRPYLYKISLFIQSI